MNIGLVDLDTSHPAAFIPILRDLGHRIVGVWDASDVHPAGYAEQFVIEHDAGTVYRTLADLAGDVDCAILHACDWDTHVTRATPFVEAGVSVLIDKPIAGRASDLDAIAAWTRAGARIGGGSALRYCAEVDELRDEGGQPIKVVTSCGNDEFGYGIHAYALALAILGPGVMSVTCTCQAGQRTSTLEWPDGRSAVVVNVTNGTRLPLYATVVAESAVIQVLPDPGALYASFLTATLPALAGAAPSPATADSLVEAERCAVAALQAQLTGQPADPGHLGSAGYDGAAYAVAYRAARYPSGATVS